MHKLLPNQKKGAPPVHPEVVSAAEVKTFKQLTTEPKQAPDSTLFDGKWNIPINRGALEYELRRTVKEIDWTELTIDELTSPIFPSTSAQYNWGRGNLGAVASVVHECYSSFNIPPESVLIEKKLGSVVLSDPYSLEYSDRGVEENSEIFYDSLENGITEKDTIGVHFDDSKLKEHWKNEIYPTLLSKALDEPPRTLCIGLPEPLKVRVITAGPSLTYSVLKPLQKWLWRNLKSNKVFRLIGEPIDEGIVFESLGKLGEEDELISGDYVASTDNLHSWVSECLADEVINILYERSPNLGRELISKIGVLLKRALTKHLIMDPIHLKEYRMLCKESNRFDPMTIPEEWFVEQKEGQLMGSIVSFPFLCLANAAACRWSMEIASGKEYRIADSERYYRGRGYGRKLGPVVPEVAPLLINGDDCALKGRSVESEVLVEGKHALFNVWKLVTAFIGLSSSVGKTFRSRFFVTMNSEQYTYSSRILTREEFDIDVRDYSYTLVKYVNFGLVYGQAKDGVRAKGSNRMGPLHWDLFETCPAEYFEKASELFLEINSKAINAYNIPKFIPEWLGGLGLKPWKKCQISEKELLTAGFIRSSLNDTSLSKFFKPEMPREPREWLMHQLTRDFIKDYDFVSGQNFNKVSYDGTERNLKEENQKLYASLIMEVFLRYGRSVDPEFRLTAEKRNEKCVKLYDNSQKVVQVQGGFESIIETFEGSFTRFHNESKIHKTYAHNERLWMYHRDVLRSDESCISYGRTKMTRKEIPYQKQETFLACFDVRKSVSEVTENWFCRHKLNLSKTGGYPTLDIPNCTFL
nr:RNA-dependent RNA polymerase [Flumine narna-like virus 17]